MAIGHQTKSIEYAFRLRTRWLTAAMAAIDDTAQSLCQSHWQRARISSRPTPVRQRQTPSS